jgi:hypothetical protein
MLHFVLMLAATAAAGPVPEPSGRAYAMADAPAGDPPIVLAYDFDDPAPLPYDLTALTGEQDFVREVVLDRERPMDEAVERETGLFAEAARAFEPLPPGN